jgi:alpha-D-xyloside xylohydrolase
MDFPDDRQALHTPRSFMLGPALLVTPVTEASPTSVEVYLPSSANWFDFWTGTLHSGGTRAETVTSIDHLPLFVRAGSLLPLGPLLQHTEELPANPIELRIYAGADGAFTLYEDDGDNYEYEGGRYMEIPISWDELRQTLTFGQRVGSYAGMLTDRTFRVVWVEAKHGIGSQVTERFDVEVPYHGRSVVVQRPVGNGGRSGVLPSEEI